VPRRGGFIGEPLAPWRFAAPALARESVFSDS
jgi:hypothetical protein